MQIEEIIREHFPLKIQRGAFENANLYARLAQKDNLPVEVYMHTVGKDVIEDVVVVAEQIVSTSSCEVTSYGLHTTYEDIIHKGQTINGWCHTHAHFPNFFSPMDVANVRHVYDYVPIEEKTWEGETFSLAYNIVFNAKNECPYGAISYWHKGTQGLIEDVPITIVPGGKRVTEAHASRVLEDALRSPGEELVPYFPTPKQRKPEKRQHLIQLLQQLSEDEASHESSPAEEIWEDIDVSTWDDGEEEECIEEEHVLPPHLWEEAPMTMQRLTSPLPRGSGRGPKGDASLAHLKRIYGEQPTNFSPRFWQALNILEGINGDPWPIRGSDFMIHYIHSDPTRVEVDLIQQVLRSDEYLCVQQPFLLELLCGYMEEVYRVRPADSSLG